MVARTMRQRAEWTLFASGFDPPPHATSVQLSFKLHEDPVSGRPFVRVMANYPLPPVEVIVAAYDAIVVRQQGWTAALFNTSSANNQQPETAIRTWAVALLVGAGWKTNAAITKVTMQAGRDDEISQERFNQDRRLLVQRFPAAGPFVFHRRSSPNTKG